MPEISVIVPVYNVEKYLGQCLDSIINQTFKDIEIICVNDGSTDNSRKILEEYAAKDSRIIIKDKENGGLSSARNSGMIIAKGNYISYIDSDDWIEPDMLEKLYKNITSLNTDIAICAVKIYDDSQNKIVPSDPYFSLEYFDKSFDYHAFSSKDTIYFTNDICVMAWNKLYKHSFLKECGARFPDGYIFEDGPFFYSIYFKTDKVSIIRDALYYYRINRKGSILQKGGKNFSDIIHIVNLMLAEIKDLPFFDEIKYDFFKKKAADIIYRYDLLDTKMKFKFARQLKRECKLFDETIFDLAYIKKTYPTEYRQMISIKHRSGIFAQDFRKLKLRMMYKIIQILATDPNAYYLKFWSVVFRVPKKALQIFIDVWYENDKIYFAFFNLKLKFSIEFRYSLLESL